MILGLGLGLQYIKSKVGGAISFVTQIIDSLIARGTIVENIAGTTAYLQGLESEGLLSKASILVTPTSVSTSVIHAGIPINGDADLGLSRATLATRINELGNRVVAPINMPRIDFTDSLNPCILIEPASTNFYLNSNTLVTQDVTTTASIYTVSFEGTGTITFSGSYSGSLVGTGVNDRATLTFTATAGTLTSTITGSVTSGQLEKLNYTTSYIPTTVSAVTRNAELASKAGISSYIGQTEGVFFMEIAALANAGTNRIIALSDGTISNRISILFTPTTNRIQLDVFTAGALKRLTTDAYDITSFVKIAVSYKQNDTSLWVNGSEVGNLNLIDIPTGLSKISTDGGSVGFLPMYAKIKCLQVYPLLTNAEIIDLTTP